MLILNVFRPYRTTSISAVFNMCFPYTSREEIMNAVQQTIRERLEDESLDE